MKWPQMLSLFAGFLAGFTIMQVAFEGYPARAFAVLVIFVLGGICGSVAGYSAATDDTRSRTGEKR